MVVYSNNSFSKGHTNIDKDPTTSVVILRGTMARTKIATHYSSVGISSHGKNGIIMALIRTTAALIRTQAAEVPIMVTFGAFKIGIEEIIAK